MKLTTTMLLFALAMTLSCDSKEAEPPPPEKVAPAPNAVGSHPPDYRCDARPGCPSGTKRVGSCATPDCFEVSECGRTVSCEPEPPKPAAEAEAGLVPEGAKVVGKWLDKATYADGVPVSIYEQDGKFFYAMEPPSGPVMRVALKKKGKNHFVRHDEDFGEHYEIKGGDLVTRDEEGPLGTAKPL